MAVSRDIFRTWRAPRAVMRELLSMGQREDRALAYLMSACVVIFIAQWPRLAREAHLLGEDLSQRVSYEMVAWLIVWPLIFYVVAIIVHGALKLFRARGSWYSARLAIFWSMLAASPAALLYGLMAGFAGPTAGTKLVGLVWLCALAIFLLQTLREAEFGVETADV